VGVKNSNITLDWVPEKRTARGRTALVSTVEKKGGKRPGEKLGTPQIKELGDSPDAGERIALKRTAGEGGNLLHLEKRDERGKSTCRGWVSVR